MNNEYALEKLQDPKFYLENFVKIKGKTPGLIPFVLKPCQIDLFNTINEHNRVIILKSRQLGFSTAVTGYFYHNTIITPGINTALIGYNTDLTTELLDKVKTFISTTPEELRPTVKYNSKSEVSFPKMDSKIIILPSTDKVGRGYTLHNCLAGDTKVFTRNGQYKKIKDIKKGDEVMNGSGGYTKVTNTLKRINNKRTLKINSYGYYDDLKLTEDHKVLCRGKLGREIWKKAGEIKKGNYIAFPYFQCRNRFKELEIKHCFGSKRFKNTIPIDYNLGLLCGWYLAEGTCLENRIAFSLDKDEVKDFLLLAEKFSEYVSSINVCYSKKSRTAVVYLYGKDFCKFIESYFGRTKNKRIDDCIWYWGSKFCKGLLFGIFSGDGYLGDNKTITLTNTNEQVINQVKKLLVSLRIGLATIYKFKSYRYGKRGQDRLDLKLGGKGNYKFRRIFGLELPVYNNETARWNLEHHPSRDQGHGYWLRGKFHYWGKVSKVEEIEDVKYVYDITVQDKKSWFTTVNGVVHNCLITELSFWEKAEEKMYALEASVPIEGKIVIESTPESVGNLYHRMWVTDDNGYEKKKYGWWWGYSFEEKEIIRKRMNNPIKFAQEYELEFLATGRPVFDVKVIKEQRKNIMEVGETRTIELDGQLKEFTIYEQDGLTIYREPEPGGIYAVGADVSEGVEGGDYSVAIVWDRKTGEEVAMYRGLIAPDLFGEKLDKIGRYYNNALMVVEVNNHGLTTLTILKQKIYPSLYFRPTKLETVGTPFSDKIGWKTTKVTRPLLIDDFAQALRDGILTIRSKKLIDELMVFVYDDSNNMVPQSGFHDDCCVEGTLIKTSKGYKEIENIKPGDLVMTHRGRYKRVEKCLEKPFCGEWYDMKINCQLDLGLSYNHPVYVATGRYKGSNLIDYGKRQWKLPGEITKSYKAVSIIEKLGDCSNKIVNGIDKQWYVGKKKTQVTFDKHFAKFLGLFLAEGNCRRNSNQMSLAFHERDTELLREMYLYLKGLGLHVKEYHYKDTHCRALVFSSKTLYSLMIECYDSQKEKILPHYYLELGNNLLYTLEYWLKGDGWKDNTNVYNLIGATTSKKLALGMRDIAWSVGYYAVINKRTTHRYGVKTKDQYFVSIKYNTNSNQFHLKKYSNYEYGGKFRKVKKTFYSGTVYNLQVEEDKSFIANGIVVHNCVFSAAIGYQGFKILTSEIPSQLDSSSYSHVTFGM